MDDSTISLTEAEQTEAFLSGLTELSMKHGIAITGKAVLFVMQSEDYAFSYRVDKDANLSFG